MKFLSIVFIIASSLSLLAGCGDRGSDIVKGIENQPEGHQGLGIVEPPSIKEQNRERNSVSAETVSFADHFGYYLFSFYANLNEMRPFFLGDSPKAAELQHAIEHFADIQDESIQILDLPVPDEFHLLHQAHVATLIELEMLQQSLERYDSSDPEAFQKSRIYFENVVINHKQMEREFNSVTEELGIK
ncbi:hypothetical protein [Bacillus alkalicellulosilyticus]|uniref:hypothetical protein n=1 Tax=Alkalihalobacterium alkalicellulosilyticum TaxID=1912214 RepID=UPI00099606B7|nr:hypothetical protein [Bacillus alkalicellulosilyticus]